MIENVHWLGHASFRIDGPKTIYFDPWKLPGSSKKADIIFVSHDHFDHLSLDDIKRISTQDTVIVCDGASAVKVRRAVGCKEVRAVSPGDSIDLGGVAVEAVAAYNTNKPFHTKASHKVGYIVTIEGKRFYHAGDTDFIPEMKGYGCDAAFLPVSGTYVMTAEEAAEAALAMKPKVAIPMHYGEVAGSSADAKRFHDLLKGKVEVKVLAMER